MAGARGDLEQVHPSREDPFVAALSESVGGPAGSRTGGHRWWSAVRVLLALTALTFALGMAAKVPCVDDEWQDSAKRYTYMCYSDMPFLHQVRGLSELHWPYTDAPEVRERFEVMEYPAGISYWAWGTAHVTWWLSGSPDIDDPDRSLSRESTLYVAVNAVGFGAVALLTTWLLAGVHRRRPWDAAGFALAPALLLTGIINWDLLPVVFVAGAAWAWARGRPGLTGVMIGLGTAVKLYPLLLLGAVLVLCLRNRRWSALLVTMAAAGLSWTAANLPAVLTGPEQWKVFWTFNSDRGADLGSLWQVAQQVRGDWIDVAVINYGSWGFFALWCVGVLVLGLRAPVSPRFAQLAFLVVAGFLLVNKVYSPQYVLWLLPLAVLARPRWRDLVIWQAGEALYFAVIWWYLAGLLNPPDDDRVMFYWVAIVVRAAAQLWLVGVVVRDIVRPENDPVVAERASPNPSPVGLK